MPGGRYEHSITAAGAVSGVWKALQDAETWAGIGPIDRVWGAEHADGLLTSFRWAATAAGRSWNGSARTCRAVAGEVMELELRSPEIRGSISCSLSPVEAGSTEVTVAMEVETAGLLAGLFWGPIDKAIRSGFAGHVEEFVRRFG